MKYTLKGAVTIEGGEPEMPLFVRVGVGNQPVDSFDLKADGRIDREITATSAPDTVEVLAFDKNNSNRYLADLHRVTLDAKVWQQGNDSYDLETDIPWELVDRWGDKALKEVATLSFASYRVQGRVVTKSAKGTLLPVPNARVEILEHDPQRKRYWTVPSDPQMLSLVWNLPTRRDTLGVVWTDKDGNFDYTFNWWASSFILPGPPVPHDPVPDIVVRVSQHLDGRSVQLAETEPRISVASQTNMGNIEVPIEDTLMLPNAGLGSVGNKGFQAIGLLPVDGSRIKNGYADNHTLNDLVSCKNAPFGGVLELYALIHDPMVTHYRLRYAPAGTTAFEEISDGLRNYVFDATAQVWKAVGLGPAKVGGVENLYRSIEREPGYLYGDKLKLRWSTHDLRPGTYTLYLEGYRLDPSTGRAQPVPSAVYNLDLRIDNARPRAKILGVYKQGEQKPQPECGIIDLRTDPKQPLRLKIDVYDAEGHLGMWQLATSYGYSRSAGDAFKKGEDYRSIQNPPVAWHGPGETEVVLPDGTSKGWRKCAYAFGLTAYGRSTDGRSAYLSSQRAQFLLSTYIDA